MFRELLAEFIGTATLVFFGTGAIVVNEFSNGAVSYAGIALTFGVVVTILIYSLAKISGAHFNPAVSLAFLILRKITSKKFFAFVISQLAGGVFGSVLVFLFLPTSKNLGMTVPSINPMEAFIVEVILTFALLFVILQVTRLGRELPEMAGLVIGATVMLDALVGGALTGASMNPVRSIAPALIAWNFSFLWIYIFAPLVGAVAAVWVARFLDVSDQILSN